MCINTGSQYPICFAFFWAANRWLQEVLNEVLVQRKGAVSENVILANFSGKK